MAPTKPTGWRKWGERAMVVSDWAGTHANNVGSKFGVERFWPTSGDYAEELNKCERILRAFTVEGVPTEETAADGKKKRKVFRKIAPAIIKNAQGLIIFTAMRSGFAPFGGAGGGGIIVTRMSDGAWSPPSFISPNNFSAGLMLGLDVYNAILVLRTEEAVKGFRTHNLTIGSDLGIAAGPLGAGISGEMGLKSAHKTPIFSYVQSRGFYAGLSLIGQAFIDRFDENERVYHWEGIKAGDIFDGKVHRPYESKAFYVALQDAETGAAQGANLEWDTDEVKELDLDEGEVLRLPPTPDQLSEWESQGIKDEEDVKFEQQEKAAVRALPPPPLHPKSKAGRSRPGSSASSLRSLPPSGANSPEIQPHHTYPGSPLGSHMTNPTGMPFLTPPAPPPRRHPDHKLGLGLSQGEPHAEGEQGDTSLPDISNLSLEVPAEMRRSEEQEELESRTSTPPPAFEEATAGTSSITPVEKSHSLQPEEMEAQRETLQVPPPLRHQDSESSVSVYSDATEQKDSREVEEDFADVALGEAPSISDGKKQEGQLS